jgi:hypothetical protein
MNKRQYTYTRGFVATVTVLFLITIIMTLIVSVSVSSWYATSDSVAYAQSVQAREASRGCVDMALRSITQNAIVSYPQIIYIDANTSCTILSITSVSSQYIIVTRSTIGNSTITIYATASLLPTPHVMRWEYQ